MSESFKRRTPSQLGEGAALKEEILRAAARMLAESGREGELSLRAVAREVGIAAPSVYLHFKSRADLVETLTRRAYAKLAAELRAARDGAGGPRAGLRAMAHRYCGFAVDNPRVYRLMFGIERIEVPREEVGTHPLWLVSEVWAEAVSAWRGQDGRVTEAGGRGLEPDAPGPEPDGRGLGTDGRVARLLWFSLHGVVAMAMAMPFAADRQALEDMADDLLDLALAG